MKKKFKLFSVLLSVVLLFSAVSISAQADDDWNDWVEFEKELHSAEYWLEPIEETVFYGSDDYAKYSYIVIDGEASIVNFHITYQGDEKIEFVLPTTLGGYPVTAIGYEYDDGQGIDATWYIHYGEDTFEKYPEYESYPEWDPGLNYISKLVIPEGYKTIYNNSLYAIDCSVSFPKSLRKISGKPFDWYLYTHVDENGKKYTVLPECQYSDIYYLDDIIAYDFYGDIYFPSRIGSEWLVNNWDFYPGTLYIPSNYSYETIRSALFDTDWDDELDMPALIGDEDKGFGEGTTIHCAPDSDFLRVFNEHILLNYYTVITDVVPAEYIEFPEETVNVCVGDVVDLEAKTYPAEAVWTACDYTVSDPSIVQIDDYSGRITALKEGTVTVTATHCERGFVDTCTVNVITEPEPVSGINEIKPATDTPYFAYGNRDYKLELTGSPSKIQVVRKNGTTTTIDRSKAQITSNGETETWIVNMRVEAGEHSIRAKYGKVWDEKSVPFTVTYDTPKAYSFDLTYENGIGTFDIVTDPQIAKIQLVLDNGATLTYSQSYSYIGEDGLRHWTVTRKASVGTNYTLKTKLGYTWTATELIVST